ncbi:MAG: hypothetical protein JW809_14120 [Pirellulales bacterium]|nr:hypothetical protein [Pirellulales bacterium]
MSGLDLTFSPNGHAGNGTVTVRDGNETLLVDRLNILCAAKRNDFLKTLLSQRPGLDPAAVGERLLTLAADEARKGERSEPAGGDHVELDTSRLIRPERFITRDVCGLAVPTMSTCGDDVVGRWVVYLRWADGTRERKPLGRTIDLGDAGRLYVFPEPSIPTPNMRPGWSAESRRRWIEGDPAPDPASVFDALCDRIVYFLDLPRAHGTQTAATIALWVILSYCYPTWPAVPYLYVGGPLGSGKSRVFEILVRLVFRPLSSSSMTAASLFRTLHDRGGVLLLDEAERLRKTNDPDVSEILAMLLAGYKAGGSAIRLEPVGSSGFKTVSFDVYGPKALACIAGLPPALASRAIPITMFRAGPDSPKPRRRIDADPDGWQRLRDDLHALALEHGPTWLDLPGRADVCPAMSGRDYELWQPILALAGWVEEHGAGGLLGLMQEHALDTIDTGRDDTTPAHDEIVLRLLAESIEYGQRPTPGELLERAVKADPAAFKFWTARSVATALKRYGLTTAKSHGQRKYTQSTREDLQRIETAYGMDLGIFSTETS